MLSIEAKLLAPKDDEMTEQVEGLSGEVLEQARRLGLASQTPSTGASTLRDSEVRKILKRSSELVRGAGALGRDNNPVALGVVFRTVIESLILLLWVVQSEENATHQAGAGLAEFARIAKINIQEKNLKVMTREGGVESGAEFLQSEVFQGLKRSKNIVDMAKEAGVQFLYDVLYRIQSMSTHGHEIDEELDDSKKLLIDLEAIASISVAIGHVGVRWLLNRERTDNKTLGKLLGLNDK